MTKETLEKAKRLKQQISEKEKDIERLGALLRWERTQKFQAFNDNGFMGEITMPFNHLKIAFLLYKEELEIELKCLEKEFAEL